MELDDSCIKLMAEIGFIAGGYGMLAETDAIAGALQVLRPESERPYLIQALARINAQDHGTAERILRDHALQINPKSAMAKSCLGLSLHFQGRIHERDLALQEVLDDNDDDEDARNLAQQLLQARPV